MFRWELVTVEDDDSRPRSECGVALDPDVLGFLVGADVAPPGCAPGEADADADAVDRVAELLAGEGPAVSYTSTARRPPKAAR